MCRLLSAAEIEAKAKAAGIAVRELCERADISRSTFSRWKAGVTEPTLSVYRRLCEAATERSDPP